MLTVEENQALTSVGPGTPMGAVLRHYWWPILPSVELKPGTVRAARLLGEDFTLFRTESGQAALVDQRCLHRSVDLSLGYVEGEGLRCPYHGWCYAASGQCVDQPLEPANSVFKEGMKLGAYPLQEFSGQIFVYIGPLPAPINPVFDRLVEPDTLRVIQFGFVPCNYLQYVENSMDMVHPERLHGHSMVNTLRQLGAAEDDARIITAKSYMRHHIRVEAEETPWGFVRRIMQEGETEDSDNWKIGQPWYFPGVTFVATSSVHGAGYRVPIDDETTLVNEVVCFTPGEGVEVPPQAEIPTTKIEYLDAEGRMSNFSVHAGDIMGTYGQGRVTDRSKEHLARTDAGIIAMRRMFKRQVDRVAAGQDPMNVIREGDGFISLPWVRQAYERGYYDDGSYTPGNAAAGMPVLFSSAMDNVDELFAEAARRRAERGRQAAGSTHG